ncbi:MAG: hypothetical protein JEZ08_22415 [Clostridiales bacterium]|nr:hypothetical protein [Clostridiales bacterium]
MKKYIILIIMVMILTGCKNIDDKKNDLVNKSEENNIDNNRIEEQVSEDIGITIELEENSQETESIQEGVLNFLKQNEYDVELDIIFDTYQDFDEDGNTEIIIALGKSNGSDYDDVDVIYYLELKDNEFILRKLVEQSGYGIYEVELVNINGYKKPFLHCKKTNYSNLTGFELYKIGNDTLCQFEYSASDIGTGHDELVDYDNDGRYDGYIQDRSGYDVLYYPTRRYYSFNYGFSVKTAVDIDLFAYPQKPDEVVKEYLELSFIKSIENVDIPTIDERINELHINGKSSAIIYEYDVLYKTALAIDPMLDFSTEISDDKAVIKTSSTNRYSKEYEVEYVLEVRDEKWTIISQRCTDSWDEFVKKQIRKLDFDMINANTITSKHYKVWSDESGYKLNHEYQYEWEQVYEIDLDGDEINEVLVHRVEGSVREETTDIYKLEDNHYKYVSSHWGNIEPVIYDEEIYFIDYNQDYHSKHFENITEFKFIGKEFARYKSFIADYNYYDIYLNDLIKEDLFSKLKNYELTENTMNFVKMTDGKFDQIVIQSNKDEKPLVFDIFLDYTSVGYAPTKWDVKAADVWTESFPGVEELLKIKEVDENSKVLYGFDIIKDEEDNVYFIKATYLHFDMDPDNNQDLIIQIYRINDDGVEEIDNFVIKPVVNVNVEYEKSLSERIDEYFLSVVEPEWVFSDELRNQYKQLLLSEIPFTWKDEYDILTGEYVINDISFDDVKLTMNNFCLLDMNNDKVPELVIQGEVSKLSGFVFILREFNGHIIGHEFSHRQMSDIKSNGSYHASGGAAHNGYYQLSFKEDSYDQIEIVRMCDEKDTEGNYKPIFFIGLDQVEEEAFWEFWKTQSNFEEATWVEFGLYY